MLIKLAFPFAVFLIGIFSGMFIDNRISLNNKANNYQTVRQKGFKYISPLLYCEQKPQTNSFIKNLSGDLNLYIANLQNNNLAQNVSVYFRIPDIGDWVAINESEKYTPASLLKIPTMMVYYKKADQNPTILTKKIKFDPSLDGNEMENIKPSDPMIPNQSYTVDNLIDRMLDDSDNTAKNLLATNMDVKDFYNVFEEVGIGPLDYEQTENFMTVKQYASFFRILYNASYLSREMSEKAISLLVKAKYANGIVAGVPQNIEVAHKFGERSYGMSELKQLHDCGIVYAPNHPYILCVMTKGNSFENLENAIATISSKAYSAVTALGKN